MTAHHSRERRVAHQMQRLLSELVRRELKDPRLRLVTLTGIDVSGDLSRAKVYFSVLEPEADVEAVGEVLQGAEGYLRKHLGRAMKIRQVPALKFLYDQSVSRGAQLSALISQAVADDEKRRGNE